jgi:hypothetical protein
VIPELQLASVTADTLRIKSEWNVEWKRREHDEWQRFIAGDVFLEQPFFYPWCELLTRIDARRSDARTDGYGRPVRHYALCAVLNPDGTCEHHSARRSQRRTRKTSDRRRRRDE